MEESALPASQLRARAVSLTVRADLEETLHGCRVTDPYRALEDADAELTRQWLAAQAALYGREMAGWSALARFRESVGRYMDVGSVGPPVWRGEMQFFLRRSARRDHPVLMIAGPGGRGERVLLDPLLLDETGNTLLDRWKPSWDGSLLAYQTSAGGTERSTLWVMETATGHVLDGPLGRCRYSPVAWLPDQSGFYYVRYSGTDAGGTSKPRREVAFHRLGTGQSEDAVVFDGPPGRRDRPDSLRFGVGISTDKRWLLVSSSVGTSPANDVWLADIASVSPANLVFRPFAGGCQAQSGVFFGRDGRIYVFTDLGAPRRRLCLADSVDAPPDTWRNLIGEDPEAVMTAYTVLDGDGLPRPVILVLWGPARRQRGHGARRGHRP